MSLNHLKVQYDALTDSMKDIDWANNNLHLVQKARYIKSLLDMETQHPTQLKVYHFDGQQHRCERSFYQVYANSYDECLDLIINHKEYDYISKQVPDVELAPVKGDIVEDVYYC